MMTICLICNAENPAQNHRCQKCGTVNGSGASACSRLTDTPRTDAFCDSLQGMGNWERWQKTASFAADLERERDQAMKELRRLLLRAHQLKEMAASNADAAKRTTQRDSEIWSLGVAKGYEKSAEHLLHNAIGEARADSATSPHDQTL